MNPKQAIITVVNFPGFPSIYSGYMGFDGVIICMEIGTGEVYRYLDPEESGCIGEIYSDFPYNGLRRVLVDPSCKTEKNRNGFTFCGYDVGYFDAENGCYSLIANFKLRFRGNENGSNLNSSFLFNNTRDAYELINQWNDWSGDKEEFNSDVKLAPFSIYYSIFPGNPELYIKNVSKDFWII